MLKKLTLTLSLILVSGLCHADTDKETGVIDVFASYKGDTYIMINTKKILINFKTPDEVKEFLWNPTLKGQEVTVLTEPSLGLENTDIAIGVIYN